MKVRNRLVVKTLTANSSRIAEYGGEVKPRGQVILLVKFFGGKKWN